VFSYDTSGSMGTFLAYVSGALRSFASDVTPGEEGVMIQPFEESTLLDHWSDNPWEIEGAFGGVFGAIGSSAAETSMLAALQELEIRKGARALLVITDAETMSYHRSGELWEELRDVRPTVFTVHVGGGGAPQLTTNLMQDWAHSWGGHYEYAASHGQIDRAFDRLATWMRRPAAYSIGYATKFVDHTPGRLTVSAPTGANGDQSVVAGTGVAVEILLDTSGSMRQKVGKKQRIQIAKTVLQDLVEDTLPSGLPVALRIFDPARQCGSKLLAPLEPLDKESMSTMVRDLKIVKSTKTPLAATLSEVAADLSGINGPKIIVLVTDGEESCDGDPEQVIKDMIAQGLDVRVNIVGFALDDADLKEQLQRWAEIGHGQAFDAQGAEDLSAGIVTALRAPFQVFDADDQLVATSVVGGEAVVLPPGTYRVEVLTDPVIVLEDVVIDAGTSKTLQLEAPAPVD
jgi:von Willebrand factor type A domain